MATVGPKTARDEQLSDCRLLAARRYKIIFERDATIAAQAATIERFRELRRTLNALGEVRIHKSKMAEYDAVKKANAAITAADMGEDE